MKHRHQHDHHGRLARDRLKSRATELQQRLARVRSDLRREREPLSKDSAEAAITQENDEVLEAIEDTSERELRLIDDALERIEQGLYGLCIRCAADIDAGRLQAVPYATHCRACAPEA